MPKTNLRTEYHRSELLEQDAGADPLALFTRWFDEAVASGARDPNAMTLATAGSDGRPSARIVLCKEFDPAGFVFFTNYGSQKGAELAANTQACLLFFWPDLERQVRIGGPVERVGTAESDAYFSQRPREARLGAWASPQSSVIDGRAALEQQLAQAAQRFAGQDHPPRPEHWGGYRLVPDYLEFWQGRASRLHDRLRFVRAGTHWRRERLAP